MFNYFTISGLCIGFANLGLALLISFLGKNKLHKVWSYVNFAISFWGFSMFIIGATRNPEIGLLGWRLFVVGIAGIALFYYHVIHIFCNLQSKNFLRFCYAESCLLIGLSVFTNYVLGDKVFLIFNQIFYIKANILYTALFSVWGLIVGKSFYELYRYVRTSSGISNIQAKYLFFAMFFGFGGGLNTAPAAWGFHIYPYGQIFVCLHATVATYAIFKHHLLDIKVAITRFVVFILVYLLVLGIPFGLIIFEKPWLLNVFGQNWVWVPMVSLAVFATVWPFLYIFLQKKAEDRLLQESRRIQGVVTAFSTGLSSVREIQKLIKLIINGLGKSLHLDFAGFYLLDHGSNEYVLKMSDPALLNSAPIKPIHPLLTLLRDKKGPMVLDELKHELENEKKENGKELKAVIDLFESLKGTLIIPAIKGDMVFAFVVLGKCNIKEVYTREFLNVFIVVGNQIALAIENAMFYEDSQKDWTERAHESRQRTMGTMATGVAHQIRNRFHAISTQFLYLQYLFSELDLDKATKEDIKNLMVEFKKIMEQIFKDLEQGEEICETIRSYAKKTESKAQVVRFEETVQGAMRLVGLSRKHVRFTLVQNNTQRIALWTNLSMLQDMFYNMLDNSNDAMGSKEEAIASGKLEKKDDFKISVSANPNGKLCEITVEDNGMGILPEHLKEDQGVNVMWFTTKGANKGTGMGIPFMREFVKNNGGTFRIESEHTKWTKIIFTLPMATDEQIKNGGSGA